MALPLPDAPEGPYRRFEERDLRGYVHETFLGALPDMGWVASAEPTPEDVLKDSPETRVYRVLAPGWPGEVVVKRYDRPGRLAPWKDRLRQPRAVRAFLAAAGFASRGVPTPEPLAAVAPRSGAGRSFLVTRAVFGFRTLTEELAAHPPGDPSRASLLEDLMVLIREMHLRHVFHGDCKPANILVREEEDCRKISLLDLDAARLRRRYSLRLATRDLAQLDSYLRDETTGAERRTFFRLYTFGWPRSTRRAFLERIRAESRRRRERRCAV